MEDGYFGIPTAPPTVFPGVQAPTDPASLNQIYRYGSRINGGALNAFTDPDGGEEGYRAIPLAAVSALLNKVGPSILFTHSASGKYGWLERILNDNVKGIVAFEPGSGFVFPSDARQTRYLSSSLRRIF